MGIAIQCKLFKMDHISATKSKRAPDLCRLCLREFVEQGGASEAEMHLGPCSLWPAGEEGMGTCGATLLQHLKCVTLTSSFGTIREKWLIWNSCNECANES